MQKNLIPQTEQYTAKNRRRRVWKKIVGGLACVVVFITTYALILPAITMEREPVCGLEEHIHTEDCYITELVYPQLVLDCPLTIHQHDGSCFDGEGNVTCGYADFVVHTHDAMCYDENGNLICQLPEIEEHVHTEDCYAEVRTLSCEEEEDLGHTHTDSCYKRVRGELICTQEEEDHEHGDSCYAWTEELICSEEERESGHVHSDDCYETERELACGKREAILHTHEDSCFDGSGNLICGQIEVLEHRHTEDCTQMPENAPEEVKVLACGLTEHTHTEECFSSAESEEPQEPEEEEPEAEDAGTEESESDRQTYSCGLAEHSHGESCYDTEGNLTCLLEEHVHSAACMSPPEKNETTELSYSGPDYTVRVSYGPDAALPEGVSLLVREILSGTEEYQAYYAQAVAALEAERTPTPETLVFARFFDVRFRYEGQILEPAAPVSVTITYDTPVDTSEAVSCKAIHFGDDGTELLDVQTETQYAGETSFTHTQDSFSVVGNLVTVDYSVSNSTDVGPNPLPVDYYVCIDGEWVCVGSTKTGWYNNWDGTEGWTNYNRDYITVAQAVSILGPYGFTGGEENPSRVTAYQQKSGNTNIYSDTGTVTVPKDSENGTKILPLSRNADHAGYNLYYLPANAAQINGVASPDSLDKTSNSFYTVKVYDAEGVLLTYEIVKTGGSFSYDASESGVTDWLVAYGSDSMGTISSGSITIDNITSTVTISPKQGDAGSHSVTFKVMIDGEWQTVGSLPYYYSGTVNGSQRAYITSAMAAQMFGDYGYTADTAPGYHFGYSYNDIYTLFYANGSTRTNFCMDVAGGTLQEAQVVQLYTSNSSDAQVFRVWDAGNGYSFITPIGNSGFHVNVYGYTTGDPSSTQLKLSAATNANSQWKVDTGSDGRTTFWSAIAPDDQVIDLSSNNQVDGGKLQVWHSTGGARYWYLEQLYRISNSTVSAQNADGTWNIGLTPESNGDIVCYYLPAESGAAYKDVAESAVSTANSFWSVSVRDDTNSVYSDGELSGMVKIVKSGAETTVTVRNADGVLWGCRGVNGEPVELESTQSEGYTTFVIKNITQPIEVTATRANPSFTVQYYANIDRYVLGSSGNLDIIDTSGKNLPTNSGSQSLLWLTLEDTGQSTNQNQGNATPLKRVKSEKQLTQMYTDGTYNFEQHPGLEYFDKLWEQANYKLDAVLVLKDGRSPDSMNDDDWWWYQINQTTWDNISFTNIASEEKAPRQEGVKQSRDGTYCILLEEGTVLRLRYETSSQSYTNQANFHDYDITSGQNDNGTWRSGITGINLSSNYVTSGNGQRKFNGTHDADAAKDVFAFGNANCETGLGLAQWGGNNINAFNGQKFWMSNGNQEYYGNGVYKGCAFGLVTGLDGNGDLIWDQWITAPPLFNDGTANGKHSYNNGSLQFNQTGDTYTLTAANSSVGSRNDLEYFFNPSPSSSTTHTHIFTNNFWPMDSATNKTDPLMGAINSSGTCDVQVNGFWDEQNTVGDSHNAVNVPISDDGRAHNWFFGMNFSLSFTLTEDYLGPLEYIFFGDDDLWVFLDGKLICDIGGVHSSVGEYVNLRDYLPVGSSGQHTLSFFYTERGASGSTCWMSFTLPSVTSAATGRDIGSLRIKKSLEEIGDADFSGEEYEFKVELLTTENGSGLNQTFSYSRSDGTYGTVKNGGTIKLHQDETVTINGIPAGTFYRVTELTTKGYHTTVNGNEGYIVSGTIANGEIKPAAFVNRPYTELPQTGGAGTTLYTMGGLLLMAGASFLLLYHHTKRRKEDFSSS